MNYSLSWLIAQKQNDYLFFWGHQAGKKGEIIKSCMSQWFPADFEENGILYKTAEHYMMAAKARLFDDLEIMEKILGKESPKDAKELGRQVRNFDPAAWDKEKYTIVCRANWLKFSQNEALKLFLLQTGDKILVEASPVDTVWGIGLAESDPKSLNPLSWRGENLLGFALMEVRDQLK